MKLNYASKVTQGSVKVEKNCLVRFQMSRKGIDRRHITITIAVALCSV